MIAIDHQDMTVALGLLAPPRSARHVGSGTVQGRSHWRTRTSPGPSAAFPARPRRNARRISLVLPWHRRSSYEPDAPARGVPQSPRWRVGLVCAKDAKFSCRGNRRYRSPDATACRARSAGGFATKAGRPDGSRHLTRIFVRCLALIHPFLGPRAAGSWGRRPSPSKNFRAGGTILARSASMDVLVRAILGFRMIDTSDGRTRITTHRALALD